MARAHSVVEAGDFEVYYDNGFGFGEEWKQKLESKRNRFGLSYVRATVRADEVRGVRIELEHGAAGKLPLVGSPMRFSETPIEYRHAPPLLGEHTEEVLRSILGKSDGEIARLRAAGVI